MSPGRGHNYIDHNHVGTYRPHVDRRRILRSAEQQLRRTVERRADTRTVVLARPQHLGEAEVRDPHDVRFWIDHHLLECIGTPG